MRFSNAAEGMKGLIRAELLRIISEALMLIGVLSTTALFISLAIGSTAGLFGAGIGAAVCFAGAGVLTVIAMIVGMIGLRRASRDDPCFKVALVSLIICAVLSVLTDGAQVFSFLEELPQALATASALVQVFATLTETVATVFVIQGVRNLAVKLQRPAMHKRGETLFKIYLVIITLEIVAQLMLLMFFGSAAQIVSDVLLLLSAVLSLAEYVLYLRYLIKAREMLTA